MTAGSWLLGGRGVSMAFDKLDGAFCQNRILSLESFGCHSARAGDRAGYVAGEAEAIVAT
jgi:hypothetical protein